MDLFDMVPESFFSMLASKNRRIYLQAILHCFKVYETGSILGMDKKILVDDLTVYLDNVTYNYTTENEEDEESSPATKRDLANYILRRMEECGWIYVDVTNDYIEIVNFTDAAITICEALFRAYPRMEYGDDYNQDITGTNDYTGYIYQINSLLMADNPNYSMTFQLVYSNTKQLIRAIRKLDSRLKEYITSVMENSEIKELMEKLVIYKTEIYDTQYAKLKINDNINRYRLSIITKLQGIQEDPVAMEAIARSYTSTLVSMDMALSKANRNIDEVIDAFNAIDDFINEIDIKNRNYINSTISKIKFLLSEDDNVVGKINRILKYVKDTNKQDKIEKSLKLIDGMYDFRNNKVFDSENSLYTPRGSYAKNPNQILDDAGIQFKLDEEFLSSFKSLYNETYIGQYLEENMINGVFRASRCIEYDMEDQDVFKIVFCIIYASDKNFKITILDENMEHKMYIINDFIIEKGV